MPVRLRDVARAAGVSTASASRALSAPSLVSPSLTARILAAAERLGYVPNLAARLFGESEFVCQTNFEQHSDAVVTRNISGGDETLVFGNTKVNQLGGLA